MQYTLADKILPAYYRTNYAGQYRPLVGKMNSRLSENPINALHYHSCAEIGICLQGSGVVHIENRIYPFAAGDLQFVPPGVPHFSSAAPNSETRWHWISLEQLRILADAGFQRMTVMQDFLDRSFAGVFHPEEHPALAEVLYKIQHLLQEESGYADEELVFLTGLLLVECARIGRENEWEIGKQDYGGKLKPSIRYIRENYPHKEAMREEKIAQICNMSSSHFRAVFKKETGMSVRDFILQTRLAGAAYLLKSTDSSVLSIALESGFGQASCFNRMFLQHFGQTPTAYRKNSRK